MVGVHNIIAEVLVVEVVFKKIINTAEVHVQDACNCIQPDTNVVRQLHMLSRRGMSCLVYIANGAL